MTPDDADLLVVDDEQFLRDAAAASLRFLGFAVTAAENGTDALRLARGRSFDLVVLDVLLPDIDGFEIVRRLRTDGNRVPVIFLTAKDTQDDKITGLTIREMARSSGYPRLNGPFTPMCSWRLAHGSAVVTGAGGPGDEEDDHG